MLIESNSKYLLKKTRAKAKMIEYSVPKDEHIAVEPEVEKLFLIAVAAIGDISAAILKNREDSKTLIDKAKDDLEFSSKYFDSYLNTQLDEGSDDYYLLLGSVAYFLCDYVGSSKVLIDKINLQQINLNANGLENALTALLQDDFHDYKIDSKNRKYKEYLDLLQFDLSNYYKSGQYPDLKNIYSLRSSIYEYGSDLELLLGDAFGAIYFLKVKHSAINLLPRYMNIEREFLQGLLFEANAIRELWPSQRQIGESGVFAGTSAVIQMPTSSGKTKSISLVIASAFLSERTKLAIVVAPFRALCREISADFERDFAFDNTIHIDELSDILQQEKLNFDTYDENQKTLIISTPEKLIYLLRQRNDLVDQIGLIIFDEGHLFDEPGRGIVYELLISTIKSLLNDNIQKVLVSAIIPNAEELNNWLNDDMGVVISDNTIKATQKTIAITDWNKSESRYYGYLYFVNPENPDEEEFYVPRLIPIVELNKRKRETKKRIFPEVNFNGSKVMHNDIAIYYGLTLCHNGGVGVFCGKKNTANSILERIMEIESRGYHIDSLLQNSDKTEVDKICKLIAENYGINNIYYIAGTKAAFAHHAGISNGIKVSIEHAMRNEKINFIVCTSTLAQGVNLPIRYLVISSMYQGKDQIRVRDFHNLIGRAGRSGLFTEGSILLTESFIYNNRNNFYSSAGWKWREYKRFIDNKNSEPCSSRILFLVKPRLVKRGDIEYSINMKAIISSYYSDSERFPQKYTVYVNNLKTNYPSIFDAIESKIKEALESLGSIESFLMAYLLDDTWEQCEEKVQDIVKKTLAYNLATDEEKESLLELFDIIDKYCIENITETYQRYVCSRSLLGVKKMLYIQHWVNENLTSILSSENTIELLQCLYECLIKSVDNKIIDQLESANAVLIIGLAWIQGFSYVKILDICIQNNVQVIKRKKLKIIELDDVIKICDNVLSYDTTVILSAVSEVVQAMTEDKNQIIDLFTRLSSELKYGLPYGAPIVIYEIGFSDRVVSQEIARYFIENNVYITSKHDGRRMLKKHHENVEKILEPYPSVYSDKLISLRSFRK